MLSEKVIQKAILEYLGTIPGIYFFRAAAGAITTSTGRFFKTGRKGLPDIVCCVPKKTDNGRMVGVFVGLEIKTEKGVQSHVQKIAEKQIEEAGGKYYIIRSLKDVKEIIK